MNYCQWVTIYYEKCLNLKAPYPTVYGNIHLRRFCSAPTYHKDSAATPIDQAQEKAYNKLAKGPGEVIGATQEKESVAKRDLTKDEKMKYTKFLDNLWECYKQNQYSTHHEFSNSTTSSRDKDIQVICKFLCQSGDICSEGNLQNIVTGEGLDIPTKSFLLNCVDRDDKLFKEFRSNWIVLKYKMLFHKITK